MEVYYQNGEPTSSNLDLLRQKYKTGLKMTEALEDLRSDQSNDASTPPC